MSIRDDEIKRLLNYAKSLNIQIVWKDNLGDAGATWEELSKDKAIIKLTKYNNKTLTILYLLHELAHHLAWVYDDRKLSEAMDRALRAEKPTYDTRRLIYEMEKRDAKYRYNIVKELNIKLSEKKLALDIQLDEWLYYEYWQRGKFPSVKEARAKRKQLREDM